MKATKFLLLIALFALSTSAMAQQKFGVVSTQDVISKMPEIDTVQQKLKEVEDGLIADMEATQKEYATKVQEFQDKAETYTQTMREQKQKDIQSLYTRIEEFRQVAQLEMQEQQQLLMTPVQEKLLAAITKVSKEQALLFVFEKQSPLYVSETEVVDITSMVLAELGIASN